MRIPLFTLVLLPLFGASVFAEPDFTEVNAAIGAELFSDDNLWDDNAAATAERLHLPEESKTSTDSSYRQYPGESDKFFGARPRSKALYGEGGLVSGISIVFANKGDSVTSSESKLKTNKEHRERQSQIQDYKRNIQQDKKTLTDTLTALFGEPAADRFAAGKRGGDSVIRWDWKGHAFLLSAPRDEYVSLRIVSTTVADTQGKSRLSDAEMRERLLARIERRPNGDVLLNDMPMVDQGPKGYCVPATWERMMRYMGVPADMYVLAMVGDSGEGGGTNPMKLRNGATAAITAAGRRSSPVSMKLNVANVSRYIDRGIPIMWGMFSTDDYNKATMSRMKDRTGMTDTKAWGETLQAARKDARKFQPDKGTGHACLIIGYNKDTGELCVSDSWGAKFKERWITEEEAQAVTQNDFFVIEI